jgi:hypothetical protein
LCARSPIPQRSRSEANSQNRLPRFPLRRISPPRCIRESRRGHPPGLRSHARHHRLHRGHGRRVLVQRPYGRLVVATGTVTLVYLTRICYRHIQSVGNRRAISASVSIR